MTRILSILLAVLTTSLVTAQNKPFRIGIAGLTHDHVHWLMGRAHDGDIEIVGIAEGNRELVDRYLKQYNLSPSIVYPTLDEMLDKARPEAVTAFNSIYEHLEVVQKCAPRKIHVMVEKPLAVSMDHALQMERLANANGIQLLTNYETTWYGSNAQVTSLLPQAGPLRKIVVHDGHEGPKEIGVSKEFLAWLTDPVKNGGGAIIDFGCYGANLMTWLMNGKKPLTVSAITQQIKPDIYPRVDDEATIIVTYPQTQGIIQASWNWPFSRKDMEVYGQKGYVIADRNGVRYRMPGEKAETSKASDPLPKPLNDPFAYFAAVVRGEIKVQPSDPSSLANNMIVVQILDAARESARTGRVVNIK